LLVYGIQKLDALNSLFHMSFRMIQTALIIVVIVLAIAGCATKGPLTEAEKLDYKSRAVTRSDGAVLVSASVLSADESRDVYGVPLEKKGIQPVWIEVENGDDIAYWMMSPGIDPNFFPASEAIEAFSDDYKPSKINKLEQHFDALAFRNPIPPGKTVSGFVLVNLDQGVKMVHVDLVANNRHKSISIFAVIPGFRSDYRARRTFIQELFKEKEIIDYTDEQSFRAALEALPCCVTNKDGTRNGDPLNLVIVGGQDDAFPALVRRGWRPTEQTWSGSVLKMINSAMSGDRYPYAPISPLYLYDRQQDFALQKARDNIHQRNHLRLWLSPMRYQGKSVWVGQISRDIGVKFSSKTFVTHKIDPYVDEARLYITLDVAAARALRAVGYVKGVGYSGRASPRFNYTEDPYYTDGLRVVLILGEEQILLDKIEYLSWEQPRRHQKVEKNVSP